MNDDDPKTRLAVAQLWAAIAVVVCICTTVIVLTYLLVG